MKRKLLIVPFFGELPNWVDKWLESINKIKDYGYDLLFTKELGHFNERVEKSLGFRTPIQEGTGKVWDYRPAFGKLFEKELQGYDYWGHTDPDVVYGNIDHFMPDSFLEEFDIISDESNYIGGHWTLYKNKVEVNDLFLSCPSSIQLMKDPRPNGWIERQFTEYAEGKVKVKYRFVQADRGNEGLVFRDGCLYQREREVMLSHFKEQKKWPL